jgi:hypothetical protein
MPALASVAKSASPAPPGGLATKHTGPSEPGSGPLRADGAAVDFRSVGNFRFVVVTFWHDRWMTMWI